jgi:probable DNA metabolism protein
MIFTYDHSYEGLLSAIFEICWRRAEPLAILPEGEAQDSLFETPIHVETRQDYVERLQNGLHARCGKDGNRLLFRCFLSEKKGVEMLIYYFVKTAMQHSTSILKNYRDEKILELHQIDKQIGREVHRMHAFVRFQETKDGLFAALIQPDFNVLPLIGQHFEQRYPAFDWLIFDAKRKYGLYWNGEQSSYVTFSGKQHDNLGAALLTGAETDYQQLWQTYFRSVDIPERRNLKLHLQHVPRRYWKYLVEKQEEVK